MIGVSEDSGIEVCMVLGRVREVGGLFDRLGRVVVRY